jgi:Ca2+-binding EF-hand superfamily protein
MTISTVGSSSLLQQLLQARASASTQTASDDSAPNDPFAEVGQNMPSGGRNGPPPPMQGWSSSGQGFGADTLASLLGAQQTDQGDRAASMFADADADGDGTVTQDELATALAANAPSDLPTGAPTAADMASNLVSSGDADGDGSLSLDEFQAMKPPHGGPHGPGGPPPGGGSEASGPSTSASTDPADLNGDGVVTADELVQTLTSATDQLGSDVSSDASDLMRKLLSQLAGSLAGSTGSATPSVDVAA